MSIIHLKSLNFIFITCFQFTLNYNRQYKKWEVQFWIHWKHKTLHSPKFSFISNYPTLPNIVSQSWFPIIGIIWLLLFNFFLFVFLLYFTRPYSLIKVSLLPYLLMYPPFNKILFYLLYYFILLLSIDCVLLLSFLNILIII